MDSKIPTFENESTTQDFIKPESFGFDNLRTQQINKSFVSQAELRKAGMTTHVTYKLRNPFDMTESLLTRRFSEFLVLREKLRKSWPGVYIPSMPPKQSIGNLETEFIEKRTAFLNIFVAEIIDLEHLRLSDEFTEFLKGTELDVKVYERLISPSLEEISKKYVNLFPLPSEFDYQTSFDEIKNFTKFLSTSIKSLKKFIEIFDNNRDIVYDLKTKFKDFYDNIFDFEKFSLLEMVDGNDSKLLFFNPRNTDIYVKMSALKKNFKNPYRDLGNFLIMEEVFIEGITEACNSLSTLVVQKDEMNKKVADLNDEISKLVLEKTTLKSFFSFKSKKENAEIKEKEKAKLAYDISYINMIINHAAYNLSMFIRDVKPRKVQTYHNVLKFCVNVNKENSLMENIFWNSVNSQKPSG